MANVKFYRGLRERYDATKHADGLYYAIDTREILLNNVSYGNTADLKLEKRAGTSGNYSWSTADTIYWGNTYRISAGEASTAITFTTASVAAGGYLTLVNGTDLNINTDKIKDHDDGSNDHENLTTKGYVDHAVSILETALNNAIVSVAGNSGASGAAGGTTVTLTKGAGESQMYSGSIYFTDKNNTEHPIAIEFDATDFIKYGVLDNCLLINNAEEAVTVGKTPPSAAEYPYLLMTFITGTTTTTTQKTDIWVSVKDLVDMYGAGNGLELSSAKEFSVKPKTNGGITVDGGGVSVKIKANNGIVVDSDGVAVKLHSNGGIAFNGADGGLEITPGNGIEVTSTGVSVKTAGYVTTDNNGNVVLDSDNIQDGNTSAENHDKLATKGYVDEQVATKDANVLEGVQINGTNLPIVSKKVNIVTNTAYNASTNKIATMADVNAGLQWIDVPDTDTQSQG